MSEHLEQQKVFNWAKHQSQYYPELALLFAIPNAQKALSRIPTATGRFRMVNHQKSEGLKKGVPDIFLPFPSSKYHGLFIELKADKGKASSEQMWWIEQLQKQGYKAVVVTGHEAAIKVISEYLCL